MSTENKNIALRYNEGDRIKGRVTEIKDYGCFVEVEEGIQGLIMVSEIDWLVKNCHPSKYVSVGDEIEVMVIDVNERRQTLSLSLKECQPNPWEQFAQRYKKQDTLIGTIDSITNIGLFIKLEGGITGHVFPMDMGNVNIEELNKGDEINVVILNIESDRERISLKVK